MRAPSDQLFLPANLTPQSSRTTLHTMTDSHKKNKGQFYTVRSDYILDGLPGPPTAATRIVEPFAGQGDLLTWFHSRHSTTEPIEAYDIDPKRADIQQRDTLLNPPDYTGSWVLTNPPYLARNKSAAKTVFDKYDTNDLYKCFLHSMVGAAGGILIIPAGFFLSPRDLDVRCREVFLSKYHLLAVRYFEEDVFPDTTTTVVAIAFAAAPTPQSEQTVQWTL